MKSFRTLTARFGSLYASVIAIVIGVCVVSVLQLAQLRNDADRVMEEAREQNVLARALSGVSAVQGIFESPDALEPEATEQVHELLQSSIGELSELEDYPDDPSRREHQDEEALHSTRLRRKLQQVLELTPILGEAAGRERADQLLRSSRQDAEILRTEAMEEAQQANQDLERRAGAMNVVLLGTLLTAGALLALAFRFVQSGVVRPIRLVKEGAERFGTGELEHRVQIVHADEIGDLAKSLNRMADQLADAQEHLEERVRARTREFLRAARLADLGVLASGIAHEINTPLASIASCADGLQRRLREDRLPQDLLAEYVDTIGREVYRARGITTRMLALVRQEPSKLSSVSLKLILDQAETALAHRASQRDVKIVSRAPADDVQLHVNGGELVQVIVNLLSNAMDASPAGSEVALDASVEGAKLLLKVTDRGPGIPEADLDRIFEPFFTTKAPGEGTGLGLALVCTMVESHGGQVRVESAVGEGSEFTVRLPIDWRRDA
ncbi:MAG: HAMP domain-containing histidine kinase [Planctomycetes bacterium]|nr:HAMP domain-containing histidine kinase [Planctomycetota bacterium]MCB9904400.1 HAMP domain-containing histidine kinase [Planctomycetota bacterium]